MFNDRVLRRMPGSERQEVTRVTFIMKSVMLLTPWPESVSELYRPSDHRLSSKLVPTFADRGCHVVSVTDPHGRILGFLDQRYFLLALKYY
jgi:CBS-domain-containing membrane protein